MIQREPPNKSLVASPPSGRYAAVCGFAASLVRSQRSASQHPYAQLMMLCVRALPLPTKDYGRCRRHQTAAPAARRISFDPA